MNTLTKQELQTALQQITNNICARTASQQDIANALQLMLPKIISRQDVQTMLDSSREKLIDRFNTYIKEDIAIANRQLLTQLEIMNKRLSDLELKLEQATSNRTNPAGMPQRLVGVGRGNAYRQGYVFGY